jgi:hypothetical protein
MYSTSNPGRGLAESFQIANSGPMIPNARELHDLRAALRWNSQDGDILRYILGLYTAQFPAIANNIRLVMIDTEHHAHSHTLTEVGFVEGITENLREKTKNPGPHGENVLQSLTYSHFRIKEHAHLRNRYEYGGANGKSRGDPSKYVLRSDRRQSSWLTTSRFGFGETRYVTASKMREILNTKFYQLIDSSNPQLGYCPVIALGHAVKNDQTVLKKDFGYDWPSTIVRTIDSQQITREITAINQISLHNLMECLDVEMQNSHCSGDDIAYTGSAAIIVALRHRLYPPHGLFRNYPAPKTTQQVMQDLSTHCKDVAATIPEGGKPGIANFCDRCGSEEHSRKEDCHAKVECAHCKLEHHRRSIAKTHKTELCGWVVEEDKKKTTGYDVDGPRRLDFSNDPLPNEAPVQRKRDKRCPERDRGLGGRHPGTLGSFGSGDLKGPWRSSGGRGGRSAPNN